MKKKFNRVESINNKRNYSVMFEEGKLHSVVFNGDFTRTVYHFNPKEGQQGVTDELLKEALSAMIGSNTFAFEMIYTAFEKQEYRDIAQQVFKEHWNNLYNTIVADDVFGREIDFSSICQKHDFFKEKN